MKKLLERAEWDFRSQPKKHRWDKEHKFDFLPEDEVTRFRDDQSQPRLEYPA